MKKHIECFRECKKQDVHDHQQRHFHMVLHFLCGIRKFSGYRSEDLTTLCAVKSGCDSANDGESGDDSASSGEFGDDSPSVKHEVTFTTLHWLFEAQDNDVIAKLLGSCNIQLGISEATYFDCFVLGYCVSHSNCTWTIALEYCNIGDDGVEMLVRGAVEEETYCTGGISKIDL